MDKNLSDRLLIKGLNKIFEKSDHPLIKEISEKAPDLIKEKLYELEENIQYSIVLSMLKENSDIFAESFWDSYINMSLARMRGYSDPVFIRDSSKWIILLSEIKSKTSKISWYPVLEKISVAQKEESDTTLSDFMKALEFAIAEDSSNLLKIIHKTDIKSYPRDLRLSLYNRLVKEGGLDVKVARRIRSDSSGDMSKRVLITLFENKNKYVEDDFQNLITQFSDTKHAWVAQYIALNMPTHLIPFLIGLDDKIAMKIIEMRMNNA
jgi:hypothetical protein